MTENNQPRMFGVVPSADSFKIGFGFGVVGR